MTRRSRGDGGIHYAEDRHRWVGQLDLGRGADGKRIRRKVVGRTKSEVAAKLRALRKEHEGRPGTTPGQLTISDLATDWLQTSVRSRHPEGSAMWDNYTYVLDHHLIPGLGDRLLRTVAPEHVEQLLVDRARSGFAPATVRRIRNTLSQVFRGGVRRRLCSWDPASFAELPPASVFDEATPRLVRTPRALRPDEMQAFLESAQQTPHAALLITAVCTGARPGELTALSDEDLDLTRGVLLICRAWKSSGEFRHLGEPKTKTGTRTVALPPIALEVLRTHLTEQRAKRRTEKWPARWASLVFTSSAGTPIHPANLRRIVREIALGAGIEHLTPYDLRHTAASLLSDAGVPNHQLADLLGHTTTRMVEIHYRHRLTDSIDVAVQPMEQVLRPKDPGGPELR